MTKAEMIEMMNKYPSMQLATVDRDGMPHTRGMFMYSADEAGIVFHTGSFKNLFTQLTENPNVEASFINMEKFIQLRVSGQAVEIHDQQFKEKIVETPGREFLKPIVKEHGYDIIRVFRIVKCPATVFTWATNMEYPKPEICF
jgi:pyridoxamine 5'-phosphate oxidase